MSLQSILRLPKPQVVVVGLLVGLLTLLIIQQLFFRQLHAFPPELLSLGGFLSKSPSAVNSTFFLRGGRQSESIKLRILKTNEDFMNITPHTCMDSKAFLNGVVTKICVKAQNDLISREVVQSGAWEWDLVCNVMKCMLAYPEATFLDLGANIGMFTLAVAAMGRKVKAVDAGFVNHAYMRTSLNLSSTFENVDLIYNGLSDKYQTLYPYMEDINNEGGMQLLTKEELGNKQLGAPAVETILVEDILETLTTTTAVMKIDVETLECKVLQNVDKYFSETGVFIPYIFIEWAWVSRNTGGHCPDYLGFIRKFYTAGYYPANPTNFVPVQGKVLSEFNDLLWIHRNAVDLSLVTL